MKKWCILALGLILLLTGCQTAAAPESGDRSAAEPESGIVLTDLVGRQVVLAQPAERVVLTFSFEEYFAVTGEAGIDKIVGWSRAYWEGRRQSTWDVFVDKFPQLNDIPDIGYTSSGTFSVESVLMLSPDLVLMVRNDYDNYQTDLSRLEAAGVPVLFVDYHLQTMENHVASTRLIGEALGMADRAEALVDFYRSQVARVTDVLDAVVILDRPKVYVEFSDAAGPDVYGATYGKQMWGAIVDQVAGDNIARDLIEGANGTIAPELILTADPDVIIFAGNQFDGNDTNIGLGYTSDRATAEANLAAYENRPGWRELSAVQNGRMYAAYHDLSRHIFDFAGLQLYAKAIHPGLFEDLDPDANLRAFHERFYPVDYTGVWFLGLED